MTCLFCQIAQKNIKSHVIYEDDQVIAFDDIHPQAPVHKVIIPRQHIATLNDIKVEQVDVMGNLFLTGVRIAKQLNLEEKGYRFVMNCNEHGGQTVFHIHLHLLGGRNMHWPPG